LVQRWGRLTEDSSRFRAILGVCRRSFFLGQFPATFGRTIL
jgi:hypothetical protein